MPKKEMTVEEVYDKVRRDKMFYDASGGGVTVSGGEPLTHADFVARLFSLCREEGINTCVETCGCVPQSAFETVLPLTDTFYFDLKLMDSGAHLTYTGLGNETILSNARFLAASGANILFRQPLIPGVNDTRAHFEAVARLCEGAGALQRVEMLPYHKTAGAKYGMVGLEYRPEFDVDKPVTIDMEPFERRNIPVATL